MENLENYKLGETEEALVCHGADESQAVAVAMLRQCERQVLILTQDFEPSVYDNDDCLEALEDVVLEGRHHVQVRILIQQAALVAQRGHRLLTLGRRMNSYIEMRCLAESSPTLQQSFLLVDGIGLLHRPYQDSFKYFAHFKDALSVKELRQEFDSVWEESTDDPYLRTLML